MFALWLHNYKPLNDITNLGFDSIQEAVRLKSENDIGIWKIKAKR